jgi:hypothetical protein
VDPCLQCRTGYLEIPFGATLEVSLGMTLVLETRLLRTSELVIRVTLGMLFDEMEAEMAVAVTLACSTRPCWASDQVVRDKL